MSAAYPAALLNWTARVNSQTVFAADPNTLAAEIDAVEQFVGVNPHIESAALGGGTKTFSNMSARLSDAMLQKGHPYVSIARTTEWNVAHSSATGHVIKNPFNTVVSPWTNYVGSGGNINIQDSGVWLIKAWQRWDYAQSGWVMMELYSGGAVLDRDVFSYSQFPQSGSNAYGERFLGLNGHTDVSYLGRLSAGQVISVASGNFSSSNPLGVNQMSLSLYYLRA